MVVNVNGCGEGCNNDVRLTGNWEKEIRQRKGGKLQACVASNILLLCLWMSCKIFLQGCCGQARDYPFHFHSQSNYHLYFIFSNGSRIFCTKVLVRIDSIEWESFKPLTNRCTCLLKRLLLRPSSGSSSFEDMCGEEFSYVRINVINSKSKNESIPRDWSVIRSGRWFFSKTNWTPFLQSETLNFWTCIAR